jgi:hypothetical protein
MKRALHVAGAATTLLGLGCSASDPAPPRAGYWQGRPNPAGVLVIRPEAFRSRTGAAPQRATASLYLPGSAQQRAVTFQVIDGMAVYQGDILLGPAHLVPWMYGRPRLAPVRSDVHYAAATPSTGHRWPGGVIPYEIDPSVTPEKRAMIEQAVTHVSTSSVVKVRPRAPNETDYALFTMGGSGYGCSSYVGRVGGPQPIRVDDCGGFGSVVHEIGHCSGLFHEQGRTDRDQYVTIVWSEISPGEESNFEIDGSTSDIGPYDYGSIMHYSRRAFSRTGNETIVPRDPNATIGQREGLSMGDKAALAAMYPDAGSGAGTTAPPITPGGGPGPAAAGFAGSYTSNRGDVTCGESGSLVNCSYPGGNLVCASQGAQLDCSWLGDGQGRAVFVRQANGDLQGTYGNLWSADDRGAWNLVRSAGGTAAPPPTTAPGFPTIPGLPPIPGLPSALPSGLPAWPLPPFPAPPQ